MKLDFEIKRSRYFVSNFKFLNYPQKGLSFCEGFVMNCRQYFLLLFFFSIVLVTPFSNIYASDNNSSDESGEEDYLKSISLEDMFTITITATKRETSVDKTAMAISVLSEGKLKELGATNFDDYMRTIPGVNFSEGLAPGEQDIVMRGVNFPSNRFMLPTVGLYLDEVALSQNGRNPDLNLIDVNRIEVLRGPQGTLYGASSMGGTIRYITNVPDPDLLTTNVNAGVENINDGGTSYRADAVLNYPLIKGKLAARLVGYSEDNSGWIDNVGYIHTGDYEVIDASLAERDYNSEKTSGGRLSFRWLINDDLTADLMFLTHDAKVNGLNDWNPNLIQSGNNGLGFGELSAAARIKEMYRDQVDTSSLTLKYSTQDIEMLWITTDTNRDYIRIEDLSRERHGLDWWVGDFTDAFDYDLDALTDVNGNVRHAFNLRPINWTLLTHELRFSGVDTEKFHWVAGVYYSKADNHWRQSENYPDAGSQYGPFVPFDVPWFYQPSYEGAANGDFLPDQNPAALYGTYANDVWFASDRKEYIEQIAAYGNFTFEISDTLELVLGVRWFDVDIRNEIALSGIFAGSEALVAQAQFDAGEITETEFVNTVLAARSRDYLTETVRTQGEDGFQFMGSVSYDLDDNKMIYLTIAEGYRVGGVNRDIPTRDGSTLPPNFNSDSLISYELGWKSNLFNRLLTLNATVYRIDWKDIQLGLTEETTSFDYNVNAGKAMLEGLEIEFRIKPVNHFEITGALTHLNHRIEDVDAFAVQNGFGGVPGDPIIGVSNENYHIGLRYAFDNASFDSYVRLDWNYVGDRINRYDGDPAAWVEGYDLMNIKYGMIWNKWDLAFYINNVTDERAIIIQAREREGYNYSSAGDPGRVITTRPMRMGFTFGYEF